MEKSQLTPREFIIVEILEFAPDTPAIKTIVRKTIGNVTAVSFNSDDVFSEKISSVDTFIQVITGKVEIMRNDESHCLETGHSLIIPANARLLIKCDEPFKLITTCIKGGEQ